MHRCLSTVAFILFPLLGCGEPTNGIDAGAEDAGQPAIDAGTSADAGPQAEDSGGVDAETADAGEDSGAMDASPGCAVAGVEGACGPVVDCTGAFFLGSCGSPEIQCCLEGQTACSVEGAPGLCIDAARCPTETHQSTPGRCPGPAAIQCCTERGAACDPSLPARPNPMPLETAWDPACPPGMVLIDGFCIDRFEASLVELDAAGTPLATWPPYWNPDSARVVAVSVPYAVPQGYISGDQAEAACAEAGKRLCTSQEWLRACRGPDELVYPYGNARQPGACNDARGLHPAVEYFGTADPWIWSELDHACINQIPDSVHVTAQHPACETAEGVFDMMGNLHEWTADQSGVFRGGFYVDTRLNGEGCLYVTTAHNRQHWDYSTGFRCCADPR